MEKRTSATSRVTYTMPAERGLETFVMDSSGKRAPSRGCRVRLTPSPEELRDDGHVLDLPAALAHVEGTVMPIILEAEPRARWTDTAVGNERVTVSVGVSDPQAQRRLKRALSQADLGTWSLEEVITDRSPRERLLLVRGWGLIYAPEPSRADVARARRLERLLAKVPSPGSFAERAGLGERVLRPREVKAALRWLSDAMVVADEPLGECFGVEDARLTLFLGTHPRVRQFLFQLDHAGSGSTIELMPRTCVEALCRFFDAPRPLARRVCGLLWEQETYVLRKAPRIEIDASS